MNEEDRRELIARQHRALYGNETPVYNDDDSHTPRPGHPASSAPPGRGPSPRSYDPFNSAAGQQQASSDDTGSQLQPNDQGQPAGKGPSPKPQQQQQQQQQQQPQQQQQQQQRDQDSTASPASNPPSQNFNLFEAAQQSSRTSTSSPGGSPPRQAKSSASGVAPIGTRPAQACNPALSKRSGTPSQSPLSYGFTSTDTLNAPSGNNERSTSSASNPSSGTAKDSAAGAWGSGSGVWGNSSNNNNKSIGAVWG
ncbi:MAG: hypothetical protein Q9163_001745 [Psora crenata]